MSAELSLEAIERGLIAQGVPADKARIVALREVGIVPVPSPRTRSRPAPRVRLTTAGLEGEAEHVEAQRLSDGGLRLVIPWPPRTKKNHGRAFGIRQSRGYVRYRDFIIRMLEPLLDALALPLDARPYNLKALYYVDAKGKPADLFGLHQGLADALENAQVICNDWWFRRTDGSQVVLGDPNPRVEVTITPIDVDAAPLPPAA